MTYVAHTLGYAPAGTDHPDSAAMLCVLSCSMCDMGLFLWLLVSQRFAPTAERCSWAPCPWTWRPTQSIWYRYGTDTYKVHDWLLQLLFLHFAFNLSSVELSG
mmetsp:Transcript_69307/g.122354  ORF Transcript_69307/g.122354 Transcript_69307/m.122354 type:complete len:103 (-) Transcript_69307:292-600(-)